MWSSKKQKSRLLAERHDELLSDFVRQTITPAASEQSMPAQRALALLTIAAAGEDELVFDALEDPTRFPALLVTLAERPNPVMLAPAAVVAYTVAQTPSQAAEANFFMAVSAAVLGAEDGVTSKLLGDAQTLDPERSSAWIAQLAELAAQHQSLLPLIAQLSASPNSQDGAPAPDVHGPD